MTGTSEGRCGPLAGAELLRAFAACLILSAQSARASDARLPLPASPARPDHLTGAVYGLGPGRSVLYRWEMERDDAHGVWRSRYYDPAGNLNTEDEVIFSVGALVRYGYVRHGVGETSSVARRGRRLVYSRVLDGRRDESEEHYGEDFAVGPTVVLQAQRHWTALAAGKEIPIRLAGSTAFAPSASSWRAIRSTRATAPIRSWSACGPRARSCGCSSTPSISSSVKTDGCSAGSSAGRCRWSASADSSAQSMAIW